MLCHLTLTKHVNENLTDGGLAGSGAARHPDHEGSPQGRHGPAVGRAPCAWPVLRHPPSDELVFLLFKEVSFIGGQYETISNIPDKSRAQLQREPAKLDKNDYERIEVPAHSET